MIIVKSLVSNAISDINTLTMSHECVLKVTGKNNELIVKVLDLQFNFGILNFSINLWAFS